MSGLINSDATVENALKNWDLMKRASPKKLSSENDFRIWTFHDMFMNHIKNMGWITSLVFTKLGRYYNIAKYFGQVRIETIDIDYQAMEISTQILRPLHLYL